MLKLLEIVTRIHEVVHGRILLLFLRVLLTYNNTSDVNKCFPALGSGFSEWKWLCEASKYNNNILLIVIFCLL